MKEAIPQNQDPAAPLNRAIAAQVLSVLMIGSALICVVLADLSVWSAAGMVVLTSLLILKRSFACFAFILVLCLGSRIAFAWRFGIWQMTLVPGDVLFSLGILVFTVSSLSYISLDPRRFRRRTGPSGGQSTDSAADFDQLDPARLRPLTLALLRLPLAVILAWVLLMIVSQDAFWPNVFRFNPAVLRIIAVIWALAMFVGLPASVLSLIRWRNLPRSQAQVYVRHEMLRESGRERKHIERVLARARKKIN